MPCMIWSCGNASAGRGNVVVVVVVVVRCVAVATPGGGGGGRSCASAAPPASSANGASAVILRMNFCMVATPCRKTAYSLHRHLSIGGEPQRACRIAFIADFAA